MIYINVIDSIDNEKEEVTFVSRTTNLVSHRIHFLNRKKKIPYLPNYNIPAFTLTLPSFSHQYTHLFSIKICGFTSLYVSILHHHITYKSQMKTQPSPKKHKYISKNS